MLITNSFHNTQISIQAAPGDHVSRSTLNRVRRTLCPVSDCLCGRSDGSRESRYGLEPEGIQADAPILAVDRKVQP
jgi:hypothetical protein